MCNTELICNSATCMSLQLNKVLFGVVRIIIGYSLKDLSHMYILYFKFVTHRGFYEVLYCMFCHLVADNGEVPNLPMHGFSSDFAERKCYCNKFYT